VPRITFTADRPADTSPPLDISGMPLGSVAPFCTLTVDQLPAQADADLILEDSLDAFQHSRILYILHATAQPGAQMKWSGRPKPSRAGMPQAEMRLRVLNISRRAEITATLEIETLPVSRRAPA
jgi:hypothetical protein